MDEHNLVQERKRRLELWAVLKALGDEDVEPRWLREHGIYGGAQGIWVDKSRTGAVSNDESGITVSFLHTGRHYPDELSDVGVIYRYPSTARAKSRDRGEIQATKNAANANLPLFVILPGSRPSMRQVKLGWVADSDDATSCFLVLFGETPSYVEPPESDAPFQLFGKASGKFALTKVRPNQQRFRFEVFKRYGAKCAVCPITEPRLLKAAHICGKADKGGDDWRNGIPLCSTHHDAFDAHFFAVHPTTLEVHFAPNIENASVGIWAEKLDTKQRAPHVEALKWRWSIATAYWNGFERLRQ